MMAARIVLLVLFFCQVERSGISDAAGLSERSEDLQVISSKQEQVLIQPEPRDVLFLRIKELGGHGQMAQDDVITPLNDRNPEDLDLDYSNKQTNIFSHPEINPEVTLNSQKNNNLTNRDDDGVINRRSLVLRSEKVFTVQPELDVDDSVRSKWLAKFGLGLQAEPHPRRRRSWLWNQFFVIEEYKGPEPVLIGRVSMDS